MNAIEAIKLAYEGSHNWYQGTIADVTAEAANHAPGGEAHPIGYVAAHILHCEDVMINSVIQGKASIWERDGWDKALGISSVALDQPTAAAQAYRCDPLKLNDYAQTVYSSTASYLDGLGADELDEEVDLSAAGMGKMELGRFLLTMLLGNNYAHTGEISALKGIMGKKGYPF
jgi:uncharacterized damage-inducible protein DinB